MGTPAEHWITSIFKQPRYLRSKGSETPLRCFSNGFLSFSPGITSIQEITVTAQIPDKGGFIDAREETLSPRVQTG